MVATSAVMATTPRLPAEDAAAATHWDATREANSVEAPEAVALSPWNAGKADEGFVDEFDRVVKLAETAEMDATAAIANFLCSRNPGDGAEIPATTMQRETTKTAQQQSQSPRKWIG